ncbi:MAG: NAD(P)-dependent alcohol dehydrogenase [Gemmataceae bacterium]|nr:NAD(P)-dependent alcohol dehydrogenase [Gemmataceae bacterium]
MKAVELHAPFGIDSLQVVDRPEPPLGPREVRVRMKAWSLNYRDLMMAKGQYNPKLKLPIVPLSDGAGEVVEIGPGTTRFAVGDRVVSLFVQQWIAGEKTETIRRSALGGGGLGVAAEHVVFPEDGLVAAPSHLSHEQAATLPCAALTAWHALVDIGRINAGDTVLTLGTGGVSLFALQFAKMHGARVISTTGSPGKIERSRQLGASEVIDYKQTPEWAEAVRQLTGGRGVDHVVEVGGAGTLPQSIAAVRLGGTVTLIGVLSAASQGGFNPTSILMKGVRVQGIFVGSRAMAEAMHRAMEHHRTEPIVDLVFPLAEIREAMRYLESGRHFGKVCLKA